MRREIPEKSAMNDTADRRGLSALEGHVEPGRYGAPEVETPGVVLEEVAPRALIQLNGVSDPGSLAAVLSRLGIAGTPEPRLGVTGASGSVLWTSADQWWVVDREREMSASDVRALCGGDDATALDLGHARTVVRVAGPMSRELLAKGCPLDVDGLEAGFCAPTKLGPYSVVLHCRAEDCFDLYVFRSFGLAMWEWLADEAAEFGYEVRRGD